MGKSKLYIRNIQALNYLELFLVAAVAAVLAIRLFLQITGYPQIGNSQLHIAHMLWGGLLMLISILVLLIFLGKRSENFSAIIGGIGFGTFIDEIGKFVTRDNDYFFHPTAAIIYVIFIIIFLVVRTIHRGRHYSPSEYLMNALREMEEVALHDLDEDEKKQISYYLNQSNPKNPLVASLKSLLELIATVPASKPSYFARIKELLRFRYEMISSTRGFRIIIIAFVSFQLVINLFYVFVLIVSAWFSRGIFDLPMFRYFAGHLETMTFIDWAELSSSLLSAVFILIGLTLIAKSRLAAFRMFDRSILVSIFLTQMFVFYREQFSGVIGLFIYLLVLVALRFMIERERLAMIAQE